MPLIYPDAIDGMGAAPAHATPGPWADGYVLPSDVKPKPKKVLKATSTSKALVLTSPPPAPESVPIWRSKTALIAAAVAALGGALYFYTRSAKGRRRPLGSA